ncbi:1-aminocyclopropane-1-carboxylate oxidase 4-like [Coffea eugenioides]|uniref:1-aminocyclopropane-1-carboxylate oxidase 4-like n=1 Tax=Coffea arabica TaxID=13443 RepID=A0A6P6X9G2_COFAR|nr:1-aminocyclopropane-1-carboxylate oxidase 4-like [Coffea arabica]XP_027169642.1 1-aminocyclopropane-1-carboxylate oxidase 4-like [Coffea eugenioides]
MASSTTPTIDLEPFLRDGDEDAKKKATEEIRQACSEFGFFQVVNHGVPLDLMARAIDLSMEFFNNPMEEKKKSLLKPGLSPPPGYVNFQDFSNDGNEHFLILSPSSGINIYPENPPEFRNVLEEIFPNLVELPWLMERIVSISLGLAPNFLAEYNNDRSCDFLKAVHYFPIEKADQINGRPAHKDANCLTFIFQNEVGGLEVLKNEQWIPILPAKGTIVVNIGDVIQVLSNDKFKSASHRVIRQKGKSRCSIVFFDNLHGDKWIEPLPKFATEIGESPKYRGFMYKEYLQLRVKNKLDPPARPEDAINITHYSISTQDQGN